MNENEEKVVTEVNDIMTTQIGDEEYYIVPTDEYDIVDYNGDCSDNDDFAKTMTGIAIGAGATLLVGLAVKGIKKLAKAIKNKKQSAGEDDNVQRTEVNTTEVEYVEADFNDDGLDSDE